jgi:hypothetical protein
VEGNGVNSCYEELRKTKEDLRKCGRGDGDTVVRIGKRSNLMAYLWAVVVVVVGW